MDIQKTTVMDLYLYLYLMAFSRSFSRVLLASLALNLALFPWPTSALDAGYAASVVGSGGQAVVSHSQLFPSTLLSIEWPSKWLLPVPIRRVNLARHRSINPGI